MRLKVWDAIEYEQRNAYYNRLMRHCGMFMNPLADPRTGFDYCGDCAREAHIATSYCEKFPEAKWKPEFIHSAISNIGLSTARPILGPAHGHCFPDKPFLCADNRK